MVTGWLTVTFCGRGRSSWPAESRGGAYRSMGSTGLPARASRTARPRSEAPNAHGLDVHIVGAGNSAGQAALFFSTYARSVTILCHGDRLEKSMSRYLIDQLATRPNLRTIFGAEVAAVHGDLSLQAIDVRDSATGATTRLESGGLLSSSARMRRRHGSRRRSRSTSAATYSRAPTRAARGAGRSTAIPTCWRRASPASLRAATSGLGR